MVDVRKTLSLVMLLMANIILLAGEEVILIIVLTYCFSAILTKRFVY